MRLLKICLISLFAGGLLSAACGDDSPTAPTAPTTRPPVTPPVAPPVAAPTLDDLSLRGPGWFVDDPVIEIGETAQMSLYAEYSDGTENEVTNEATWASSNEHVATVDEGLVTGRNRGGAELRVSFETLRVRWSFRVIPPPEPWRASGTGATILDLPTRIRRIRIEGRYDGRGENFIIWCGVSGSGRTLLVNEILGTGGIASGRTYSGIHSALRRDGQPCRELQVRSSQGIRWSITETSPRSGVLAPPAGRGSLAADEGAVRRSLERVNAIRQQQ